MSGAQTSPRSLLRSEAHYRLEQEGDCLHLTAAGEPSLDEVILLHREVEGVIARYGWAFMIIDGRAGFRLTPEARRWITAWHAQQGNKPGGTVTFGASVLTRTFMSILSGAIGLIARRQFPIAFVADEPAARAWIDRQRSTQGLRRPEPPDPL